jgi:hypothetical protein
MYYQSIKQFAKMLNNLNTILDKAASFAEHKKSPLEILLESRLVLDQFNLIKQIQITCDTAKSSAGLLAGHEVPSHPDNEKNLIDLKSRIEKTLTYLETFKESDFSDAKNKKISRPRWEGKYLSGEEFLTQHALPNFYFHFTTAYSILRHNGVELGKKDYLGPLPYKS